MPNLCGETVAWVHPGPVVVPRPTPGPAGRFDLRQLPDLDYDPFRGALPELRQRLAPFAQPRPYQLDGLRRFEGRLPEGSSLFDFLWSQTMASSTHSGCA